MAFRFSGVVLAAALLPCLSSTAGSAPILPLAAAASPTCGEHTSTRLTTNHVVACVELRLTLPYNNFYAKPGDKTPLEIIARDASGAIIVGPGPYLDENRRPLTIEIANSEPENTALAPSAFSRPTPVMGVSNVATITYKGRAHFHFPTFTVANRELPSIPKSGLTLTYVPQDANDTKGLFFGLGPCLLFPSVGGLDYGGPLFALRQPSGCGLPTPADIVQLDQSLTTFAVYEVNSKHDSNVTVGYGADKRIYFAYATPAASENTVFGSFIPGVAPTSAIAGSKNRYVHGITRSLTTASAHVALSSGFTLGHDGSLWFTGTANGRQIIGKLPRAGTRGWSPQLYAVPDAISIFSLEPGIGSTEALLYTAHGRFYIGTIGTDLSGFRAVAISPNVSPSLVSPYGDLLAGVDGSYYIGATYKLKSDLYKISDNGVAHIFCHDVERYYRLSDGTGVTTSTINLPTTFATAIVHIVPGGTCSLVPYPYAPLSSGLFFNDLLGVDSTTQNWIYYENPNGHRLGVF